MTIIFWGMIFVVSLALLVKGADWLLNGAEKIGLALGLSSFVVGVIIVGLGTSFPELVSSFIAVMRKVPEIVAANAMGSNIANILLVVGVSAIVGKRLMVSKSLINLDLPLLTLTTIIFLGVAWDARITFIESIFLLISYTIYCLYTIFYREDENEFDEDIDIVVSQLDGKKKKKSSKKKKRKSAKRGARPKIKTMDVIMLLTGTIAVFVGAKYLIDSVVQLSELIGIGTGAIALAAVALGTSLPELIVSVKAAYQNKPELALGNIFGSNVFNILMVVALPGLLGTLVLDAQTFALGLPALMVTTLLFIISGISRRIYMWEGAMYLVVYVLFIGKLFGLM